MRQITYRQLAPEGSRFARGAFDGAIGQSLTVTFGSVEIGTGRLVKAEVVDDGQAAMLTVDVPDEAVPPA